MAYRIISQYRAYGGLTMTEDGFFTIIDPSYYENEVDGCLAAMNFNAGLEAAQKIVMGMGPMRNKEKFTQREVIEAIEKGKEQARRDTPDKLPITIIQIVVEDDPNAKKPIPLKMEKYE